MTYYDEVALKGLQLAANDFQRRVLDHEQLDRVKNTIKVVVRGLPGHGDKQPPTSKSDDGAVGRPGDERDLPRNPDPQGVTSIRDELPEAWQGASAVLCIAGRGPLGEAALAMLVPLLGKHGTGGRLVGYDEVSRERIETLAVTKAAMACISYLDISGSPAHLRYLMQRLRQRLPHGTPILVGMWPSEDATLKDKSVQAAIGADDFTSSLEQAVTTCSEAAHKAGSLPQPWGAASSDNQPTLLPRVA